MNALPELVPISDLRTRQAEVLAGLADGPVILTQHSRAAAVLLSTEQYNQMLALLEELQDSLDAREARRDAGPAVDFDEYARTRAAKRGESVQAASQQPGAKRPRPARRKNVGAGKGSPSETA